MTDADPHGIHEAMAGLIAAFHPLPPTVRVQALADHLAEALAALPAKERFEALNTVREKLHAVSPNAAMPVDLVRWVPMEQVQSNDYNPNHVARVEMELLLKSIMADGYTQPVVAIWDPDLQKYIIVDGFHRYASMRGYAPLQQACLGHLPVVVIEKQINDRMASTIRHNRARGKHSIKGMANMIFSMLDQGWQDAQICNELGMEAEELVKMKHITGFSKLFKDTEYSRAWVTRSMVLARLRAGAKPVVQSNGDHPDPA